MSRLTGSQVKQTHDALLSAYRSPDALGKMVRFELDRNLAEIAGGNNLSSVVFDLITWAESRGLVGDLIAGAVRDNPANADLQALAAAGFGGSRMTQAQTAPQSSPLQPVQTPAPTPRASADDDGYSHDVFISYSHKDGTWVWDVLLPKLEGAGLRVCIDDRDFELGVPSVVNMERAVERSRRTLLVLSPNWVNSEWTEFESILIQTNDPSGRLRRMIPLMREACKPPSRIAILTYVDFTAQNDDALPWDRLLRGLKLD